MKLKLTIITIALVCFLEAIYYPVRDILPVDMSGEGEVYYKVVVTEEIAIYDYIDIGLYTVGTVSLILLAFLILKTNRGKN